jgi:hypothetical protein
VSGIGLFNGAVTGTAFGISIVTTSATTGTQGDNYITTPFASTAAADNGLSIPGYRISLSATTTVYLTAISLFTGGTCKAYGRISATRVA